MAERPEIQYVRYYADGTAARKVEPVQPFKTLRLPKLKKRQHPAVTVFRVDPVATLGIIVSVVMLVLLVVGSVQFVNARQEAKAMERYVYVLEQENARLQGEFDQRLNLDHVKQTADALGLVPVEQVRHITMQVPVTERQEEADAWDRFVTFLAGLFA